MCLSSKLALRYTELRARSFFPPVFQVAMRDKESNMPPLLFTGGGDASIDIAGSGTRHERCMPSGLLRPGA